MEAAKRRGGGGAAAGGDRGGSGEPRGCGCKGIRSCLLCEAAPPPQKSANFVYCPLTGFAVGENQSEFEGWAFQFPGVFLLEEFINTNEEYQMVELMDRSTWKPSQSGRRKQDYGPKVNFKKQKLKAGYFSGLPSFSKEIVARMRKYPVLESFSPVEQCNLDYDPERGSAIDPHWDDWWLWGERLVSLNLLSDTVLSMSCDSEDSLQLFPLVFHENKQMHGSNSPDVSQEYRINDCSLLERLESTDHSSTKLVPLREILVAIYLPQRSLVVLSGPARYQWKHAIYRNHIKSRRICITFRELTAEFGLGGEQEELGNNLLDIALTFKGSPV
ncbi:alpha-ketoglutarate-dependent dioxygenase alkB homolog 4-like [Ahaetulla prasina]|uniref:alpha-ketoglutarate-dependent dioxygenase alkB homolog 4-like n=1 Tax=Ahaetulla prasina TaxID=499056 RepID=UPI00264964D7|nr:alpha-ketoglutarate-dependent dioxygenase alkB homolog 4-like [Ahaetulla prasina]